MCISSIRIVKLKHSAAPCMQSTPQCSHCSHPPLLGTTCRGSWGTAGTACCRVGRSSGRETGTDRPSPCRNRWELRNNGRCIVMMPKSLLLTRLIRVSKRFQFKKMLYTVFHISCATYSKISFSDLYAIFSLFKWQIHHADNTKKLFARFFYKMNSRYEATLLKRGNLNPRSGSKY